MEHFLIFLRWIYFLRLNLAENVRSNIFIEIVDFK